MFAAFAVVMPAIDESDAAIPVRSATIGDDYKVTYYPKPANKDQAVDGNQALDVKYENNTFTFDGFVTATAGCWATIDVVGTFPALGLITETNPAISGETNKGTLSDDGKKLTLQERG